MTESFAPEIKARMDREIRLLQDQLTVIAQNLSHLAFLLAGFSPEGKEEVSALSFFDYLRELLAHKEQAGCRIEAIHDSAIIEKLAPGPADTATVRQVTGRCILTIHYLSEATK